MFRPLAPILLLALVLALAPFASGVARADGRYIDVRDNSGGNVLDMVRYREKLAKSGKTVRIMGYCRSACTMLTTLPNACFGPYARIGFHAPRLPGTTIIPPYVDQIMGNYYRNGIRSRWFGGWNRSIDMKILTVDEYIALDPQARICDSLIRKRKR